VENMENVSKSHTTPALNDDRNNKNLHMTYIVPIFSFSYFLDDFTASSHVRSARNLQYFQNSPSKLVSGYAINFQKDMSFPEQ